MKTDLPTYALLILAASHIWPDFGAVVHAMTLGIWWLWACIAAAGVYVWLCTPSIDEVIDRALADDPFAVTPDELEARWRRGDQ